MPDAFISYARQDAKDFVKRLTAVLEARGKDIWIDLDDIPPASRWQEDLVGGVESSDALVFVLSPGSVASQHCIGELAHAEDRSKRIIPINHLPVAGELPEVLVASNWIPSDESFEADFDRYLDRLIEAIETDLDWVRGHTLYGARAAEWERESHDSSRLLRGSELVEGEAWLAGAGGKQPEPSQLHYEFLAACRLAQKRRQRTVLGATAAALVVTMILAAFALVQRNRAEQRGNEATSRALAANGFLNLDSDPELTMLLGLKAAEIAPTGEAEDAIRAGLAESRLLASYEEGSGGVSFVSFNPRSGAQILTAGEDGSARLLSTADSGPGTQLDAGDTPVLSAGFSADGERVVTSVESQAQVWSTADGSALGSFPVPSGELTIAALSPDGSTVVSGEFKGDFGTYLWDAASGELIDRLPIRDIRYAAFLPGGRFLLLAPAQRAPVVWDLRERRVRSRFEGDAVANPTGVGAIAPDGSFSVVAGEGGEAFVRDLGSGRRLATLRHQEAITDVDASVAGRTAIVATASADGTVRAWTPGGELVQTLDVGGAASAVALSPDGELVATATGDGRARLWEVRTGNELGRLIGHDGEVADIAFNPNGRRVVTAGADGRTLEWDATSSGTSIEQTDLEPFDSVLAVSPDQSHVLTFSGPADGGRGELYSVAVDDGSRSTGVEHAPGSVPFLTEYAVGNDGRRAMVDGFGGREAVAVVDLEDPSARVVELDGIENTGLNRPEFSPDGDRIAVDDAVYSTADGARLFDAVPDPEIGKASFSPDGELVAVTRSFDAGDRNEVTTILDAEDGSERARVIDKLPANVASQGVAGVAAISPDNRLVAITRPNSPRVVVADARSGEVITTLAGHPGGTSDAAFSPDSRLLVTTGLDDSVRLWEPDSGRLFAAFTPPGAGTSSVGFRTDSTTIGVQSFGERAGSRVISFHCLICGSLDELRVLAAERVTRELTERELERYGGG